MDLALHLNHHLDWQHSGKHTKRDSNTMLFIKTKPQNEKQKQIQVCANSSLPNNQLFILFLGGAVVGPIFDKYGSRALMFSGTAVCLLSFICSSFATQFYQYLLAQGILLGIGNALL